MTTAMNQKTKEKYSKIKAVFRTRIAELHKMASEYMDEVYGLPKMSKPRIFFQKHPEAWAYTIANMFEGKKCIEINRYKGITIDLDSVDLDNKEDLWIYMVEILPHEMAHWAMYHIQNYYHDKEWRKCAIYLGATGSRGVDKPKKHERKIHGVYTYKKYGVTASGKRKVKTIKVIGRPLDRKDVPVLKGAVKMEVTDMTYTPHATKRECIAEKHITIMNLHKVKVFEESHP
jgi:hypothetical protein